jgi:hypothetical protein
MCWFEWTRSSISVGFGRTCGIVTRRTAPGVLAYAGHILMENRNGLVSGACLTRTSGTAEREAALARIERRTARTARITLGADKGYDVAAFITALRARSVTPHIAADTG